MEYKENISALSHHHLALVIIVSVARVYRLALLSFAHRQQQFLHESLLINLLHHFG